MAYFAIARGDLVADPKVVAVCAAPEMDVAVDDH
jgi:hypothetical protein